MPLDGGQGSSVRAGALVLKPCADDVEVTWFAGLASRIVPDGFCLPAPVAALDGRWTVDGWAAVEHVAGVADPEGRWQQVVAAGRAFHAAVSRGDRARPPGGALASLGGRRPRRLGRAAHPRRGTGRDRCSTGSSVFADRSTCRASSCTATCRATSCSTAGRRRRSSTCRPTGARRRTPTRWWSSTRCCGGTPRRRWSTRSPRCDLDDRDWQQLPRASNRVPAGLARRGGPCGRPGHGNAQLPQYDRVVDILEGRRLGRLTALGVTRSGAVPSCPPRARS